MGMLYLKISSIISKISSNDLKISSNDLKVLSSFQLKISFIHLKISSNNWSYYIVCVFLQLSLAEHCQVSRNCQTIFTGN